MTVFRTQQKRNIRILAVDDDPLQLRVLSSYLESSGFPDVTTADSADSALTIIFDSLEPFDIFLLDIRMPGMDGTSLCRKIHSLPGYSDSIIIMISSLKDKTHVQEAFDAGAVDYVTKPFDILELTTRIKILLTLSEYRREAMENQGRLDVYLDEVAKSKKQLISGPVSIDGIASVVDYVVLCNLILQAPLHRTFSANAFAVRINGFELLVEARSFGEQYQLLLEVAKVLSDSLAGQSYFVSYVGSGTFVCASHRSDQMEISDIGDSVRMNLEGLAMQDVAGSYQDITLTIGPKTFNHFYNLDRRVGLLLRSIEELRRTFGTGATLAERMREKMKPLLQNSWMGRLLRVFNA